MTLSRGAAMSVTLVACPSCGRTLRLSAPLPAGKRLGCPSCGAAFAPAPPAPAPAARFAPAPPRNGSPPAPAPAAPRSGRGPLLLGLVFGGLLLLGGGALLLAFALGRNKPEDKRQAAVEPPRDKEKPPDKKPDDQPHTSDPEAPKENGTKEAPPSTDRPDEPKRREPPPGRDPRSDDPPKQDPPKQDPPKQDPPRQDPPKQDPPKQDPPKQDPPKGEPARLPPELQEKVNRASDRGLAWLRKTQQDDGGWTLWGGGYKVGCTALGGLTLLECGVPPDDPQVKKAAAYVRAGLPGLTQTYELSTAVLFLDRLGDPADEPLLRTLALRLVAGQLPSGGWNYNCPLLGPDEEERFLKALQLNRARNRADLMVPGPAGNDMPPPGNDPPDPAPPGARFPDPDPAAAARMAAQLPPALRNAPALLPPEVSKKNVSGGTDDSDNSNTQFAALALLAAGRHGVPTGRTLALVARRFRSSGGGGVNAWAYKPSTGSHGSRSMTGAGLLGLAIGYGLGAGPGGQRQDLKDPRAEQALARLGESLNEDILDLYFLWTLERVALLFNLPTVGGKDWYAVGAERIVKGQKEDGSWQTGNSIGSHPLADTCFALLFLKRANLAKELTRKLDFVIEAKDPGKKP
jgi:hypothetical protein